MINDEVVERILAIAVKQGFSVERVTLTYTNRVCITSKMRLVINGFQCRLHHLVKMRTVAYRRYVMLGPTRSSLQGSDFVIVSFSVREGVESFLIIPSSVLLSRFSRDEDIKRFYIPVDCSWVYHVRKKEPAIEWFLYKNAWSQLGVSPSVQNTSAIG